MHAVGTVAKTRGMQYEGIDCATSYTAAQEHIRNSQYGLVLLDHRMPRHDQGDLEQRDMRAFSDTLEEIGYGLIPEIRERSPGALIIGTSSLSVITSSVRPEFTMRKMWDDAEIDLEQVLAKAYSTV
jgi:CheY-like chemotaxis protein